MKLVISDEDILESWETLINTVDKTDIPIEFVRTVNLMFHTPVDEISEQDIDIQRLRNNGWEDSDIEEIVEQIFREHHNNIKSVHFFLDIKHIAGVVQHQTNILLKDTK